MLFQVSDGLFSFSFSRVLHVVLIAREQAFEPNGWDSLLPADLLDASEDVVSVTSQMDAANHILYILNIQVLTAYKFTGNSHYTAQHSVTLFFSRFL